MIIAGFVCFVYMFAYSHTGAYVHMVCMRVSAALEVLRLAVVSRQDLVIQETPQHGRGLRKAA